MEREFQRLPETPLNIDSTSSLAIKDDKPKKRGDYHSSLPQDKQEPPQIRLHEEIIAGMQVSTKPAVYVYSVVNNISIACLVLLHFSFSICMSFRILYKDFAMHGRQTC